MRNFRATTSGLSRSYRHFLSIGLIALAFAPLQACALPPTAIEIVETEPAQILKTTNAAALAIIENQTAIPILVDADDYSGVLTAVQNLQSDIQAIGSVRPDISTDFPNHAHTMIIVGSLDSSDYIRQLVESGKLNIDGLEGEWEAFSQEVIEHPFPGVDRALVIAGSDMRGTIYGVYDFVDRAGVSPWAWWADVPVKTTDTLVVMPGRRLEKPAVKYRGLFLNDENPALYGWVNEKFGGFNHKFYGRVFELTLRQKGNYLWPAMWGKGFYDDDPMNAVLANEVGVVIGTSHHEPLGRAHIEWERYGEGAWNYDTNKDNLDDFWRFGVERIGDREALVTIGMRGDGDEAMSEGTAISLLESVVANQREIIADVTGKPASETPQIWALYKEVQDYYDQGMQVPDDVTLLFSDDNWGNIRRLPALGATRPGGYGVYYHFDYVGDPRNYKWLNTTQIERVWEQMNLADQYNAKEIWIVNVGDLKPMEYPISFFLDMAWDPTDWPLERLKDYPETWAGEQFGPEHAAKIGEMLTTYTTYNSRRKPELLGPETYSLINYNEAERIVADYNALAARTDALKAQLPEAYHDAYMQLVWFPIHASANLNELYLAAAQNRLYAEQGRAATNDMADKVQALFDRDIELTRIYHQDIADGKWNHLMAQTHIGYTYWQQPNQNNIPETTRIEIPDAASMGVAVSGSRVAAMDDSISLKLPLFDPYSDEVHRIEIFNRGKMAFDFTIDSDAAWVKISPQTGRVDQQVSTNISIDWNQAPEGEQVVTLWISGPDSAKIPIAIKINNTRVDQSDTVFVEQNGFVSFDATDYHRKVDGNGIHWDVIPHLSRTGDGITVFPVTAEAQVPGNADTPNLQYDVYFHEASELTVDVTLAPTLDFMGKGGLLYAVSIDDQAPVIVNVNEDTSLEAWKLSVANSAHVRRSTHTIAEPGRHTVTLWMVDPALVFQSLVVSRKPVPKSYLGPPASEK